MSEEEDTLTKSLKKAAKRIAGAGVIPFPQTDTFIDILKLYLTEEEANFIGKAFRSKYSLSLDEIIKKSKKSEEDVLRITDSLAKKGFIFNQPSSKGILVFRLLPIEVTGTFEYTFMPPLPEGEERARLKKLAELYHTLIEELRDRVQEGYDVFYPIFEKQPTVDRTVSIFDNVSGDTIEIEINKEIEAEDTVLPAQKVEEIINKFDDIAVGNCFCRQQSTMLEDPCKLNSPLEVCFTFGKSARHVIQQGFARKINKDEALKILKECEDAGLVHRTFHDGSNIMRSENSICNCCKDCCHGFTYWRLGALPIVTSTNHLSSVIDEDCIGCGICIEKCPTDALSLNENDLASVNSDLCIGCGLCAHFCPENAIKLIEGMRKVFIPPPKM